MLLYILKDGMFDYEVYRKAEAQQTSYCGVVKWPIEEGRLALGSQARSLVRHLDCVSMCVLCIFVCVGVSTVGRVGSGSHDIQLTGALVAEDHWLVLLAIDTVIFISSTRSLSPVPYCTSQRVWSYHRVIIRMPRPSSTVLSLLNPLPFTT